MFVELSCVSTGSPWLVSSGTIRCRQHLAQFDAPLIERVDLPDRPLREHAVLIECDQRAECLRRQPFGQDGVRGTIAFKAAMWDQPLWCALRAHLLSGLPKRQRLGLCEDVGHQEIVMIVQRIQRLAEADDVARNQTRSLVDQLVKRVLTVRAGLAPVDRSGLIVDPHARRASRACHCFPS